MGITLEKLKEINLEVGDLFEMTVNTSINERLEKNKDNHVVKEAGYFHGTYRSGKYYGIEYTYGKAITGVLNPGHVLGNVNYMLLPHIEDIVKK